MFPFNLDDVLVNLVGPIGQDIQDGYEALKIGIRDNPSFTVEAGYEAKNTYFLKTQGIGSKFFRAGSFWAAEMYYRQMLNNTFGLEEAAGKHFNKGMAFANLGIAEIALGKHEIGIAHLLTAEREDRPVDPNFRILDSRLWQQFETHIFSYLFKFNDDVDVIEWNKKHRKTQLIVDQNFLETFLRSLSVEDRIFLEGTLLALLYSHSISERASNPYSLGRQYSSLKDVCLLIETLLRKNQKPQKYKDFSKLLKFAIAGKKCNIDGLGDSTFAWSLKDFLEKLEALAKEVSYERRWLCHLLLVRNFTGHHFDVTDGVLSPTNQPFFPNLYEAALRNVLLALLYLIHIGAL